MALVAAAAANIFKNGHYRANRWVYIWCTLSRTAAGLLKVILFALRQLAGEPYNWALVTSHDSDELVPREPSTQARQQPARHFGRSPQQAIGDMDFRIGMGHDTHRLVIGGPLLIGGIEVEFDHSLDGHSDADVLLHAITDAILGAAAIEGMGDIGEIFPDTDEANFDRDSGEMLSLVMNRVAAEGYQIGNLDCIVFAQEPKLSPYKTAIARRIAKILNIDAGCVGVKAKTGEGVGPVGEGRIIQAQCVALLKKS